MFPRKWVHLILFAYFFCEREEVVLVIVWTSLSQSVGIWWCTINSWGHFKLPYEVSSAYTAAFIFFLMSSRDKLLISSPNLYCKGGSTILETYLLLKLQKLSLLNERHKAMTQMKCMLLLFTLVLSKYCWMNEYFKPTKICVYLANKWNRACWSFSEIFTHF